MCTACPCVSTKAASVRVGTEPSPGGMSLGEFAAQDCRVQTELCERGLSLLGGSGTSAELSCRG